MLTFEKILVIVTMIIVTFGGNIIAIDEGGTCSFPGGKLGVCTKLPECTLIDNGLKDKTISPRTIVRCSFVGNTLVVCCPDRVPTNIKPTRQYTHSQGGIVFLGNVNRRDRLYLPNSITTTRKPKVLFTVKNITITDDFEYIDLTQLLKKRNKKLESSSISPSSLQNHQNHPLFMLNSSLPSAQLIGKLVLEQTSSPNTINFNKNSENINNFNRRPSTTTTAESLVNWNQGNNNFDLTNNNFASNHRNEKMIERELQSYEQNLDYQRRSVTTTTITPKNTIDDPWAPFEYRNPTPESYSTERPREFSSSVSLPTANPFGTQQNQHNFNQLNNNEDFRSTRTTTSPSRYEELNLNNNNNNHLDPWMKDALNSDSSTTTERSRQFSREEISFQGSGKSSVSFPTSNTFGTQQNQHSFKQPNNNEDFRSARTTTSSSRHEELNLNNNNNNHLDPWMKDALNSDSSTTTERSRQFSREKNSFQGSGKSSVSFPTSNTIGTQQNQHSFNQLNNNEDFRSTRTTAGSSRHEELNLNNNNNNHLDPWMKDALNSDSSTATERSRQFSREEISFQGSGKSSVSFPASNTFGTQQNQHSFNQLNNNQDFRSTRTTASSSRHEELNLNNNNNNHLEPWMKDALNSDSSTTTERSRQFSREEISFQGSGKSSVSFPASNTFGTQQNQHSFNQLNNNEDFRSTRTTAGSSRHEELNLNNNNNNHLDPWIKDALNSDRNQEQNNNLNSNPNFGNSNQWTWHTSTTTQRPIFNSWSNQNSVNGNGSPSSTNLNNFTLHSNNNFGTTNPSITTTSTKSSLYPWDIKKTSTTTVNPFLDNNRPVWGSYSESDDNYNIPSSSRGSTRKAVRECENYKSDLGPRIDFHIIDGEPTKPGEFPHMAGLGYREFDTDEYTWDCGGSLISKRYILTAAHCVDNPKRQPKLIRLGKTTVRNNDDGAEAVDVQIKKISIHPEYRSFAKYHDIALIEMTKVVTFNNEVGPACLYTNKDDLSDSEILVATGWGVNDVDKRTNSNFLLKVNLTSNPLNNCNQSYFDYGFTRQYAAGLVSGQMCAYDKRFDKDSCQGDSGGPLQLVNDSIHLSTIVGLTSFGIGCASAIPSVYTRVAFYLDWIESIVWP